MLKTIADTEADMAIMDDSIYKWRFIQYEKRHEFLRSNFPQIAPAAKGSMIKNGVTEEKNNECTKSRNKRHTGDT